MVSRLGAKFLPSQVSRPHRQRQHEYPASHSPGVEHQAWVLETSRNFSSPRVSHIYLIDRPPYYLGTETVNLDTGERKQFVWLRSVELLEP